VENEVTRNSKSQITNIKQITMTKIVRASLGLPILQTGPQFQNSKPVLVIENASASAFPAAGAGLASELQ
jgi:hypothetical protein